MLPPNILTSLAQTRSWCVPFNFKPSWYTWTLLMAYCRAKLKSNSDKTSPCFKSFLIGNMSDKFLPTRNLPCVSVRHIVIGLRRCIGISNSNNILQDLPLDWIISFLKFYKELVHCFVVFPFFLWHLTYPDSMISSWPVSSKSTLMIPIISFDIELILTAGYWIKFCAYLVK